VNFERNAIPDSTAKRLQAMGHAVKFGATQGDGHTIIIKDGVAYGANDKTEGYIKQAGGTLDTAKRIQVLQEFENYVFTEHVPWIWLWHQQDIYGASNTIDWKARSDELMSFDQVSFK